MSDRLAAIRSRAADIIRFILNRTREARPMLCFMFLYLVWFNILEDAPRSKYYVINCGLDDMIPVVESFIIPYMAWFFFVPYMVCYMYFKDIREYHRLCTTLVVGMVVFLVISTFFPTILFLRPGRLSGGLFSDRIRWLYVRDTSTNVFPSIHCYNSLCVMVSAFKSTGGWASRPWFRISVTALSVSIILSTVFIKQHSVLDVAGAVILFAAVYILVYRYGIVFISGERTADAAAVLDSARTGPAR